MPPNVEITKTAPKQLPASGSVGKGTLPSRNSRLLRAKRYGHVSLKNSSAKVKVTFLGWAKFCNEDVDDDGKVIFSSTLCGSLVAGGRGLSMPPSKRLEIGGVVLSGMLCAKAGTTIELHQVTLVRFALRAP